jgi:hypothetical protein
MAASESAENSDDITTWEVAEEFCGGRGVAEMKQLCPWHRNGGYLGEGTRPQLERKSPAALVRA